MTVFLDTDVLIDCLRGTSYAQQWLENHAASTFFVPGVVAMELVMGCRNQAELRRIEQFLANFPLLWPQATEFVQAYQLLSQYRLSHGIGISDCLIAAMALSHSARLYTFNLKHFAIIPNLDVQRPYERQ